jgi:hypothetical protein
MVFCNGIYLFGRFDAAWNLSTRTPPRDPRQNGFRDDGQEPKLYDLLGAAALDQEGYRDDKQNARHDANDSCTIHNFSPFFEFRGPSPD